MRAFLRLIHDRHRIIFHGDPTVALGIRDESIATEAKLTRTRAGSDHVCRAEVGPPNVADGAVVGERIVLAIDLIAPRRGNFEVYAWRLLQASGSTEDNQVRHAGSETPQCSHERFR